MRHAESCSVGWTTIGGSNWPLRLTLSVTGLQVGHHGIESVKDVAVRGKNKIVALQAGLRSRRIRSDIFDFDRTFDQLQEEAGMGQVKLLSLAIAN
jgi:hypothetical protein